MFKNIKKFVKSRGLAIPILGLVLTVGASAQRIQPVSSKQIARLQTASIAKTSEQEALQNTWIESNPDADSQSISKEARLRRVLDSSSTDSDANSTNVLPGRTYTWIQGNNSSSYEEVAQELENASRFQAKVPGDKVSVKGALPANNFPNGNGVFLYGTSQKPGEFGKGYIVFEKQAGKVTGGMYMPSSEFNCFQGTLDSSGGIAMTVKGYAGDIGVTQIAARGRFPKQSDSELANYSHSVTLQNYYQLDTVSENDQRILKTCKANFQ